MSLRDDPETRETTLAAMTTEAAATTGLATLHAENDTAGGATQNYELVERISDGGQATVFKARIRDTQELVALKIFKTSENDPVLKQRFQREAQILASLNHPHIVGYKGVFSAEGEWGEARQCIVMEFLEGMPLKECIQLHAQGCPWALAAEIFRQSLIALIYARNERGVIHRDLKPSNIHVLPSGDIKLIDFGIARTDVSATHTGGSGLLGSFDYMAPDFARVKDADFRGDEISDIFSLFVCFYETITGKLPYARFGERPELEYLRRWHGEVEQPATEHAIFRVITHLSRFIQKGLAADRRQRYQNWDEVLRDFEALKPRVIVRGEHERYTLLDALGAGGFSEVYKAQRASDGKTVAIKRLFANRSLDRFIKEAEMLSLHPHPNVVRYHDFFETESASGRTDSFLVMEYLDGMPGWSLRERIREHPGGLPVDEMLETFGYYLATLAYLYHHKHSVVHRDIKPANLYAPEGQPAHAKLLDFGGARDVSGTKTTGGLPGTWDYMAPEFVTEGTRGTHQSDLYALGLSLYEALAGHPAYPRLPKGEREALNEYLARARGQSKVEIRFQHDVFKQHPALIEIIQRATARDPKARYADALQMRAALSQVLERDFGRPLPAEAEAAPPGAGKETIATRVAARMRNPFHVAHEQHRRKAVARIARVALLLALLGMAGALAWLQRQELRREWGGLKTRALARWRPAPAAPRANVAGPPAAARPQTVASEPRVAAPEPRATPVAVQETPPPATVEVAVRPEPPSVQAPVAPAVPTEEEIHRTLLYELQLSLEPLTYFVAAGSKYDTLRVEILKSAGMLQKTLASPKYATLADDPAVAEIRTTIWHSIFKEVLSILREQRDLTLLPLIRGCVYTLFSQQPPAVAKRSSQARYEQVLADIRKQDPELPLAQYLPLPPMREFQIATDAHGAWLTDPFLDEVFTRAEAKDVRARMLPQRATFELSARPADGPPKRKWPLAFVLVPDGDAGAIANPQPFYMASEETTLEAMRCYRDDAARWGADYKKQFSGAVAGQTLGHNDQPYTQAKPGEALEFCNWASALAGLPPVYQKNDTGQWVADLRQPGFRLPTAAEWEYAARYGFDFHRKNGTPAWDEMLKNLQAQALVHYYFKEAPRRSKEAARYPLGMSDLCGNVEEICMANQPADVAGAGVAFVLKGGSAKSRTEAEVSPAYVARTLDATHEFVGFRIVLPVPIEKF